MNINHKSGGKSGTTDCATSAQPPEAGRPPLAPLGTLEDVLASDAPPEVKAACIELAIVAEGRRGG